MFATSLRKLALAATAAAMLAAGCTTTTGGTGPTPAEERQSIEDGVEGTMTQLQANVPGARALLAKASGVLVFPRVIEAGFVVGGEHGHGALRVGGRTRGYYQITGLSLGLQAGAQSKALVILFLTPAALERFLASNGWTAGADASVAVIRDGANATVDSISAHADVTALALTNSGLMAAAKVDGSKITRLDLSGGRL